MDSSCTVYGCWFESWMIEVSRDPPSLFPMPMMQDPVVGDPITATAAPREPGKTAGQRSATPIRAAHRAAQGSRLACLAFTARLQAADVRISMGENGPWPRWCRVNRSNQGRPAWIPSSSNGSGRSLNYEELLPKSHESSSRPLVSIARSITRRSRSIDSSSVLRGTPGGRF